MVTAHLGADSGAHYPAFATSSAAPEQNCHTHDGADGGICRLSGAGRSNQRAAAVRAAGGAAATRFPAVRAPAATTFAAVRAAPAAVPAAAAAPAAAPAAVRAAGSAAATRFPAAAATPRRTTRSAKW